jgi:hypothetical protein
MTLLMTSPSPLSDALGGRIREIIMAPRAGPRTRGAAAGRRIGRAPQRANCLMRRADARYSPHAFYCATPKSPRAIGTGQGLELSKHARPDRRARYRASVVESARGLDYFAKMRCGIGWDETEKPAISAA